MQVIRTVVWIVITAILVAFIAMNWNDAAVNFWPLEGEDKYLHFEWPVGVIALVFFALGALPMWALHRARVWQLNRRIGGLENSVRAAAAVTPVAAATDSPTEEPEVAEAAPAPKEPAPDEPAANETENRTQT